MNRTGKNYVYNVLYQLLVAIVPIITVPYLSRVIGKTGSGIFSYYASIVLYFTLVVKLGTQTYGTRAIAAAKRDSEELSKVFSCLVYQSLTLGFLMMVSFVAYALTQKELSITLILSIEIIAAALDINWLYSGLEEFKLIAIRNATVKIINTICVFIFVKTPQDLWKYALIISLGTFVSSFILWWGVKKRTHFSKINISDLKKHLLPCIMLFIPTIATSIYKNMDKIILGKMDTMDSVGLYTYAEKIPNLLLGFVGAMGTVMLPRISSLLSDNKVEKSKELLKDTMRFIMLISSIMSFGLAAISIEFAPIFFGEEFTYSGVLMIYVALAMVLTAWSSIIRNMHILPHKKDRYVVITVSIGAIINLIVDLLLIPFLSCMGATIGLVCAEISIPITQYVLLRKKIDYPSLLKESTPFIVSGIIMFIAVRLIGNIIGISVISIILEIACGATIFAVLLCLYYKFIMRQTITDVVKSFICVLRG